PPLVIFNGNPAAVAVWNSIFNAGAAVVLFFFAKDLFKSKRAGIIAVILASTSFYFVEYSPWLSNPSPTLLTVPLFFYFLWRFWSKKSRAVVFAAFFLGLSIQFELFFLYLIPVFILYHLFSKNKNIKDTVYGIIIFSLATSTMILTEIKYHFAGVVSLLDSFVHRDVSSGQGFLGNLKLFVDRFFETYSQTILPVSFGKIVGVLVFVVFTFFLIRKNSNKKGLSFLGVYLFSPFLMLLLGYHGAPWFLISLPPAMILLTAFLLDKAKSNILLAVILVVFCLVNLSALRKDKISQTSILEPDKSSYLTNQLKVVDYTYQSSGGDTFTINSVTNPLYINAVWSYNYEWYGISRYNYVPSWSGGDQLYPYDSLEKPDESEKYLYMIIDDSPRIPEVHKILAVEWADERSTLVETLTFGQILVQKREFFEKKETN
ncbi:glycosyltransferase family 39 protein, partial [Patescibacteria group bacterium]